MIYFNLLMVIRRGPQNWEGRRDLNLRESWSMCFSYIRWLPDLGQCRSGSFMRNERTKEKYESFPKNMWSPDRCRVVRIWLILHIEYSKRRQVHGGVHDEGLAARFVATYVSSWDCLTEIISVWKQQLECADHAWKANNQPATGHSGSDMVPVSLIIRNAPDHRSLIVFLETTNSLLGLVFGTTWMNRARIGWSGHENN